MKKVTYYMYSYDTCCMSREDEISGLDCTKCQNQDKRDTMGIKELLMIIRRKMNSVHLLHFKPKNMQWLDGLVVDWGFEIFRERERAHSL